MKNLKGTGIVTLLIMCAVLVGFGVSASADGDVLISGYCGDNITYELTSDGVLAISGYGDMYDYDSGSPWQNAYYSSSITSIIFDSNDIYPLPGITSIGNLAFQDASITDIDIPETVTSIGRYAFRGCELLKTLTLPPNLTTIEEYAFANCYSLTTIEFPDNLTTINRAGFTGCTALETIEFPDSLTSIGSTAFSHCDGLISVTFPDSLNYIGDNAFYSCSALETITFPENGVETIEYDAFHYCESLASVYIPEGTVSIGNDCFAGCTNLRSVSVPDSITYFGRNVFNGTNWYSKQPDGMVYAGNIFYGYKGDYPETIVVKDGTVCIASQALYYTSNIKTIILPNSVRGIGNDAFRECTNLTYIRMSDNVSNIGDYAFYGCTSLTGVRLMGTLTEIPEGTLRNCTDLETVVLSSSVSTIGNMAFKNCTALNDVYYGGSFSDWDMVYIDSDNSPLVNVPSMHYGDTSPTITALELTEASIADDIGAVYYIAAKPTSRAATFTPEWTSSNSEVATVEDGYVTFVSAGSAVITASIGSLTAQCTVYVTEPDDEEYPYTIVATSIKTIGGEECEAIPDGAFYAEVTVSETTERESNDYFVAAAYDSNGALIDVKYIYTNVCEEPLSVGFYFNNAAYVRFFVWDALGTMIPLAETAQII